MSHACSAARIQVKPRSSTARLVGVILTKNEASNLAECIDSVGPWVDKVVVWDSGSTDETRDIARNRSALVVHRPFDNYAAQRQAALDTLNARWILFVDADERLTDALGAEIQDRLDEEDSPGSPVDGFWIPRRNFIAGREVHGGGFYPDYQLRLLRRGRAHYVSEREVHEIVQLDGEECYAEHPLLHYNYRDWRQFHHKQRFYAHYEARILDARGVRPRPHNFILQPIREFRRRFITLRGHIDGLHGLRLALWLAWYYGVLPYYVLLTEPELRRDS
jgi:(heptosyl)LPS beta-1,4-glucosyltransferase